MLKERPVVVGFGPAGIFCAYFLAKAGYRPVVLERGKQMEERVLDVEAFWKTGNLSPQSNVQFGEGGAGTFSDGKLNTMIKDKRGLGKEILKIFVHAGAEPEICYENKPHIGTDLLRDVIVAVRREILAMGGEIRFQSQVTDLCIQNQGGRKFLTGLIINGTWRLPVSAAVFCIGHSARDTFAMLYKHQIPMEAKSFAVGLRIEHPQKQINLAQYGREDPSPLKAADYKLTFQTSFGRPVFTFCMCPGGQVVNASSEKGMLAINGMSCHLRDGRNANSAVIAAVTPADYPDPSPLGGVAFQRELEKRAFQAAGGKIPVQLFSDFEKGVKSRSLGKVVPDMKGGWAFGNLKDVLPEAIASSIEEGIRAFGKKIPGFSRGDAVLSGVESRSSSPVRVSRNEHMESEVGGLYPCGEGAGYAGGIMSAAIDGMKAAEAIISRYQKPE